MRTGRTTLFGAVLAVAIGLILSGCSGSNSIGPGGNTTSQVRAFNALQGCPANVDFEQINVAPIPFTNVAYGAAPGAYTSLRSGLGLHYGVFSTGQTANALALKDIDLLAHDSSNANSGTYTLTATGICGV